MRNIILQTALSLYSQAGSSISLAGKTAALEALKSGVITKPDGFNFDAVQIVYNGYDRYLYGYTGPTIQLIQGAGSIGAVFNSATKNPAQLIYPYTMGYYDQLQITKIHLRAGGTVYATADVTDVTLNSTELCFFTHTVWCDLYDVAGNYIYNAAYAIADAYRTGSCDKITGLQYKTSTGGSTLYTADNFGWNYGEYVAHADTAPIANGHPIHIRLVNSSGSIYATTTPYTSQTPAAGNSYDFQFTIGTI